MSRKLNPLKMIIPGLLWAVIAGIWLTPGAFAAETGSAIRQISPMGEMSASRADIRAEDYFDVIGILNLIEGDRMIIGDRELKIAPGVNTSRARQFNLVGAKLNKVGEVVVFETISDEPN